MPDIPGNSSTTTVIMVDGAPVNDQLEFVGDRDWVAVNLTAGQKITILVDGISLDDSYLRVRDSAGNQLAENDDISLGSVRDSRLVFTAPSTGTYYLDIGAFNDAGTGTYQLSVTTWAPPPVAPVSELATFLTDGYWGGERHHFAATQGSTINVNVTQLTAAGQTLAREALALWSDVTGITFREVSTAGQITFDDNDEGAFAEATRSNGITTQAHVNVSTQWLTTNGTSLSSYSFQTYVHEIGHALGLGHQGYYNGDGNYATDAEYANDAWSVSVMSYFDQIDNSYFSSQGFSRAYAVTPMVADIQAMGSLYGLSTITRTGDTTYGFGNNSGRAVFTAAVGNPITAYTIVDSGGIDTLNYSGFSSNQLIDLNPEAFSNIGGGTGNVSIGFGTIIENAVGGNGNDFLIGNSAANTLTGGGGFDILRGGAGSDMFRDTGANLNSDAIADFTVGDSIIIIDANISTFTYSLIGQTLNYSGGSLTLTGGISGTLTASAAAGGGVQLAIQTVVNPPADVRNDFNGDGRSDILWRNSDGQMSNWLGQANGGFVQNNANAAGVVPIAWAIAGTGDFNGDGRDDILWRNSDGQLSNWLATASGGYTPNNANAAAVVPTSWQVVGTGDFNGDGRDDILWRNSDGTVSNWLANSNGLGGFIANDANAARFAPTSWTVVGTGDFNGDGRDDILWRNSNGQLSNWLGQANGGFVLNDAVALTQVDTAWKVVGTGDFNGDGRDDILWRNDNGTLSTWNGQANGGFLNNGGVSATFVPLAWSVVAVGDYNGDGRDDILWRNTDGTLTDWLANPNGSFTPNDANAAQVVPTSWEVQPDAPFL